MGCLVEPPALRVPAEPFEHAAHEPLLARDGELAVQHGGVDRVGALRDRCDQRHERGAQLGEERGDFGALHPLLVVVEQHVVGILEAVEALDVALLQLDVALQERQERGEVGALARVNPCPMAERARARQIGRQVVRHTAGLLVVAPRDADQRCVVGVRVGLREPLLLAFQIPEQTADRVVGEALVDDPPECPELLRAQGCRTRRHHRLLVPAEQSAGVGEVLNLCESLTQFGKC